MKRIILVLLCILLIFSFCGCGGNTEQADTEKDTPTIILPDETTKQTLGGYKENDKKEKLADTKENETKQFYANKSSKKFHLSSCGHAQNIKNLNLYITTDRTELITEGYNPCLKCNP